MYKRQALYFLKFKKEKADTTGNDDLAEYDFGAVSYTHLRAVQVIYRPYLVDPKPENMPILADLHKALLDQHIPEADRVAQALDLYVCLLYTSRCV